MLLIKTKVLYILGVLLIIWGFQYIFSHSYAFRSFYLSGFYPWLSTGLRRMTGWCSFSLGDILYILGAAWLLLGIYRFVRKLILIKKHPFAWLRVIFRFVLIVLVVYLVFLVFWGFNYRFDRLYADFGISREKYSPESLEQLCDTLIQRTNALHLQLTGNDTMAIDGFIGYEAIRQQAIEDYQRMADKNEDFSYNIESIKPSMFGSLMNFAGVTGYYNPFTGEAQINTTPPAVSLPFTTCHEMAHQLGFAAEDDANFISYIITSTSPNPYFRYSANFSLLLYAINALSFRRPEKADSLWNTTLTSGVKRDYDAYFNFYRKFRTRFKPLLDQAYDQYLKANEQKLGIRSYRGVVALLLSYEKKYGGLP